MFDGTYRETEITPRNGRPNDANSPGESREDAHRRKMKEWEEYLSNLPGKKGRRLRVALTHGWW
jgi:hypothetical protein